MSWNFKVKSFVLQIEYFFLIPYGLTTLIHALYP